MLRFRGGEELFNAADFFERQPLPSGRRIAIVSNSAGVATLAADACATGGLQALEPDQQGVDVTRGRGRGGVCLERHRSVDLCG